jgi:hypothetical protein
MDMNIKKYMIPAVLSAVLFAAGMAVIAPVQQAQTVHTFINNNLDGMQNTVGELICTTAGFDAYDADNNECFNIEA